MEFATKDTTWYFFTLPAFLGFSNLLQPYFLFCLAFASLALLTYAFTSGGLAWKNGRNQKGHVTIHGPRGLPLFGSFFSLSRGLAHRTLASMASSRAHRTQLMAFSLGSTPTVVASHPQTAREILTSPFFADRPIKQSAKSLMFTRAMGFAPNGTYWRLLRKISSSHLFAPKRITAHECGRLHDCATMLRGIASEQARHGTVALRRHLRAASLNNIMGSVFGKRYDAEVNGEELRELEDMVREGFEILGAFNLSDYLPWLSWFYDPLRINERCANLVPRVRKLVRDIIEEHRASAKRVSDDHGDFVDVLLSLDGDEKLAENDMIAVLWEMIFRGTDTTALLTEWAMAELILNPKIQDKLYEEIHTLVADERSVTDADVARLPYLQAVVKETLRVHPPGPLLSWARLSTSDVHLSNGMVIPSGTTAMVNMWAIGQSRGVWGEDAGVFKPERFVASEGGADVDVRGGDTRLAPFGAGRRVCPGKNLGLVTASLWVAKLVKGFKWGQDEENPVDLSEVLKLSCEMKHELHGVAVPKRISAA